MTKPEMVALISQEASISKKAATNALDAIVKTIHSSLKSKEGRIRISSLGTFQCSASTRARASIRAPGRR